MAFLGNFTNLLPAHSLPQQQLLDWTQQKHLAAAGTSERDTERIHKLFDRFSVKEHTISRRHFECEDPVGSCAFDRHRFFSARSLQRLKEFYQEDAPLPDHMIHVTCTGYVSPSAPQMLSCARGQKMEVTHAYHMGCYAALPAIRVAQALVSERPALGVDIVHNELCGLHLNPTLHSPEQIIVQSLFSDGHIRYSASQDAPASPSLHVQSILERIIPNSVDAITWTPAEWGMAMSLSHSVPKLIQNAVKEFVIDLCASAKICWQDIRPQAVFAIHPGGPKILDLIQQTLELHDEQLRPSREVLFERGNMSSATLPHIWQKILQEGKRGTLISLAFGPGLTVFGSVMEVSP